MSMWYMYVTRGGAMVSILYIALPSINFWIECAMMEANQNNYSHDESNV